MEENELKEPSWDQKTTAIDVLLEKLRGYKATGVVSPHSGEEVPTNAWKNIRHLSPRNG